jgi:hypothetical protein
MKLDKKYIKVGICYLIYVAIIVTAAFLKDYRAGIAVVISLVCITQLVLIWLLVPNEKSNNNASVGCLADPVPYSPDEQSGKTTT